MVDRHLAYFMEVELAQHVQHQSAGTMHMRFDYAGIDAAEDEVGELWQLRRGLAEDQACLRLHQVLETYTDVTRFPP